MDGLAQQDHTYSLSKEEFKIYQGHWYLTSNKSGKTRRYDFDQIFELQSLSKTVFTASPANRLQNQFLHTNTGDGTLPQATPGATGTRPEAGGAQVGSFTVDGDPLQPTGSVHRYTSHVTFSHALHTC